MELAVRIPDDVAQRLSAVGGDSSRRAQEALVAEEYKQGHLTKPDLRRLPGFETGDQIDSFLLIRNSKRPAQRASVKWRRNRQPHERRQTLGMGVWVWVLCFVVVCVLPYRLQPGRGGAVVGEGLRRCGPLPG
jgi:hypothetical protein